MCTHFIGIDVQVNRGCACAIVRADGSHGMGMWGADPNELLRNIRCHLEADRASFATCMVAVDSPRRPLEVPRQWYWNGKAGWRRRREADVGNGRHCEVVISAHRLANPQWTPLKSAVPDWMKLGFEIFAAFGEVTEVLEVFPSASYESFRQQNVYITVNLGAFQAGPKDMLDAYVCAATATEFAAGRGVEVGGGDGLGTIVLPRPLARPIPKVLEWPSEY